ncbi:MAG: DUF3794 domain-containing protein [Bacillota bacterium]
MTEPNKVLIQVERVVGHGTRQKLVEESINIEGIKIVEIVPTLRDIHVTVKAGKVIVQGVLHKQIYFIGADGLEHHLAEDIDWSELVEIVPEDHDEPVVPGMNEQTTVTVENLIWEFDPDTGLLIQKAILLIQVKVTVTEEINVLTDPQGPLLSVRRVIGCGAKQKLVQTVRALEALKVVDIQASLRNVRVHVKLGKAIIQGVLHKQVFYVGLDNLVHHVSEDIPWSDMVEIDPVDPKCPATEGMGFLDLSAIENRIWEFDPDTGTLVQKIVIRLEIKVTERQEINVGLDPEGVLIATHVVRGRGERQKLVEEIVGLEAIKIVNIAHSLRDLHTIVKDTKVIVQGVLHKQVFFVAPDGLVRHLAEDIPFSDIVEIVPLDPDHPAREGMGFINETVVENLIWEFDPELGRLVQKAIILLDVTIIEAEQLTVADP